MTKRICTWDTATKGELSLLCGQPATVVIERRELGTLALCDEHQRDPAIWIEAAARGWHTHRLA